MSIELDITSLGKEFPCWRPHYDEHDGLIDADHKAISENSQNGTLVNGGNVKGSLRVADGELLYEMAYNTRGNILELGTYHGLSSILMSTALRNANSPHRITSVDLAPGLSKLAAKNLADAGLEGYVEYISRDGASYLDLAIHGGKKFGFAFIDHSHAYAHVCEACTRLPHVLNHGAFVVFHDFNDPRNPDPGNDDYGVAQGVADSLDGRLFYLVDIEGCCGLFRYMGP